MGGKGKGEDEAMRASRAASYSSILHWIKAKQGLHRANHPINQSSKNKTTTTKKKQKPSDFLRN